MELDTSVNQENFPPIANESKVIPLFMAHENLTTLKVELKCWESMFHRKHGRKPNKADINESSSEIRDSYKRYARMKSERQKARSPAKLKASSATEKKQSKGDGDVFGQHLNKSAKQTAVTVKPKIAFLKNDAMSSSWRPKLKPMRRSHCSNKIDDGNDVDDETKELSENKMVVDEKIGVDEYPAPVFNPNVTHSVSNKIIPPTLPFVKRTEQFRRRQSFHRRSEGISMEWLKNCKESLLKDSTNDSTSGVETKLMNNHTTTVCTTDVLPNQLDCTPTIELDGTSRCSDGKRREHVSQPEESNNNQLQPMNQHSSPMMEGQSDTLLKDQKDNLTSSFSGSEERKTSSHDSSNHTETKHTDGHLEELSHKNYTTNANDDVEQRKKKTIPVRSTERLQSQSGQGERNNNCDNNVSSGPLEPLGCSSSALPRNSIKRKRKQKVEEDSVNENSKKVKLTKKAAAKSKRLVSENFVKIDLRKKTYVRGLKKAPVSSLKRRTFRSKTAFELPGGGKSGGKCFKCGGEGHWAKFCRGKPKRVDPFSKLDSEKESLEYKTLLENKGSCFDDLYNEPTSSSDHGNEDRSSTDTVKLLSVAKKFTVDDIMPIEPCWPRTPYNVDIQENDIKPLYAPDGDNPSKEAYKKAKGSIKMLGFTEFREGQHEAVARVISGLSTLVILATGSGKSLCYQLPAYMYFKEHGWITIVVSPLVALMQDQLISLPSCLPGASLNSNMTKLQQQKVVTKLKEGKIAVLLVSPEALVSGAFGTGILPPKSMLPPIAFACIDEAHCLSEWSHNFRPSYLKVCKVLRDHYQIKCLLGLTATASHKTAKSVTQHLGVPGEGSIIRDPNPIPENLQITSSRDNNRDVALVELLQEKPFDTCDSIIVYVTRRIDADRLAVLLRTSLPDFVPKNADVISNTKPKGKIKVRARKEAKKPTWWNCEAYHAGLTPAQRKRVQNQFMSGELRIVVATVAFGMGLDKSDVRSVIHYNMPKSFENFVQEIGRAGRDGKPSFCHVFLTDDVTDLCELKRHVYGDTVDRQTIKRFVDMLFPQCECHKLSKQHKLSPRANEMDDDGDQNLECFQQKLDDDDFELFFSEEANEIKFDKDSDLDTNTGKQIESAEQSVDFKMLADDDCDSDNVVMPINNRGPLNSSNVEKSNLIDQLAESQTNCNDNISQTSQENQEELLCTNTNCNCSGHRVALPIDGTVSSLDVREEIISTMLAYLELHAKKWLQVLNPLRSHCTVKCYGGPEQYQLLLRKFPPVAIATKRLLKEELQNLHERRQINFDLVEITDTMCWDILTVIREVKSLQWNMSFALDAPLNGTGKSGIIVETDMLSFHFTTAPGIGDVEREEVCDYICDTVSNQEEIRLLQMDGLYSVLKELSCQHHWQIPSDRRIDQKAREQVSKFFLCDETQQTEYLRSICTGDTKIETLPRRWSNIAGDIRSLLVSYPDEEFSARAVARIFQGIESPRYPAITYGRDRRFWRQYLDVDFNELRRFAVREVIKFRT